MIEKAYVDLAMNQIPKPSNKLFENELWSSGKNKKKKYMVNKYYKMMMWLTEEERMFNHSFIQKIQIALQQHTIQ